MASFETRLKRAFRWVIVFCTLLACDPASAQVKTEFPQYDYWMTSRPTLQEVRREVSFDAGLIPLWRKALQRPDAQLQRMTLETIRLAKQRGVPEIDEMIGDVMNASATTKNVDVVRAACAAMIEFDARRFDRQLADLARQYGYPVGSIVEPALANWKSDRFKDDWMARIQSFDAGPTQLRFAINGLLACEATEAADGIRSLFQQSSDTFSVQVCAARALSKLSRNHALEIAEHLVQQDSASQPTQGLLILELIGQNDSSQAVSLLNDALQLPDTAIQSGALERLYRIDKALVDAKAETMSASQDVNVRRWCLSAMLAFPKGRRAAFVASFLNDPIPSLRRSVASGLIGWGEDEKLRDDVISATMSMLDHDAWRGCEQATVVLTRLNHGPAGERLVQLLDHPRPEVQIAAAWGLKELRLAQHLPEMLSHAESVFQMFRSRKLAAESRGAVEQLTHLLEAFGDQRYRPAESLLRAYLPKNHQYGESTRAAACWAIGRMLGEESSSNGGTSSKEVADLLQTRFLDIASEEPETNLFRQMCAVSFGNMNDRSRIPLLRKYAVDRDYVGQACAWSLEKMTGEKSAPIPPIVEKQDDWFLKPIEP